MRYFNKKTMTEVIQGIHEINDDVIALKDDHWFFTTNIPGDKKLTVDKNGQPLLIDIIESLSDNDKIVMNKFKKQHLIKEANSQIILLQRAVKYNLATTAQKQLLEQLELYTIEIDQVDSSDINAVFPDMPE